MNHFIIKRNKKGAILVPMEATIENLTVMKLALMSLGGDNSSSEVEEATRLVTDAISRGKALEAASASARPAIEAAERRKKATKPKGRRQA